MGQKEPNPGRVVGKDYFECHVTFLPCVANAIFPPAGWTMSRIDGDPDLGKGVKHYLTRHFRADTKREDVIQRLQEAASAISDQGHDVLRQKIELVIFDLRAA